MAGNMMKNTSRSPRERVSRNASVSLRAAWADMVGSTAVAIAMPKMPSGKWMNRMP